jgi:hypothetical protein
MSLSHFARLTIGQTRCQHLLMLRIERAKALFAPEHMRCARARAALAG